MVHTLVYQQCFHVILSISLVQSKTLDSMLSLQSYPGRSKWGRKLGMSWMNRMVRMRLLETRFASLLSKIVVYFDFSYNCTAFCP